MRNAPLNRLLWMNGTWWLSRHLSCAEICTENEKKSFLFDLLSVYDIRIFFSGFLFISFKPSKPATSRRELKLDGTRAEMSYVFLTVKVIKHTSSLQGSKSSTATFQKDKLHSNWSFGLSAEITGWTSMADYTGGQMYLFWFWAQINSMAKDAQGMLKHNN